MIKGFSKETQPLTDYETGVLLPLLVQGLRTKIGHNSAVTNKHIVTSLKPTYKISDTRVRKIINHIRTKDLVPGLIATSEGYFIAETESELIEYEELQGYYDTCQADRFDIYFDR